MWLHSCHESVALYRVIEKEHRMRSTNSLRPTAAGLVGSCYANNRQGNISLCALTIAILISLTSGCATPQAVLNFTAPAAVAAGSAFTVTVTATIEGMPDTIINSYISFTSSDPAAILPSRYQFTPADAGSHTWTNGFTLMTAGNQTISATIFDATGINGTAYVAVSP